MKTQETTLLHFTRANILVRNIVVSVKICYSGVQFRSTG